VGAAWAVATRRVGVPTIMWHAKGLSKGCTALWPCRVAALAQERIYCADQKQHWLNLVLLLFSGADSCDKVLKQKAEVEMCCKALTDQVEGLHNKIKDLQEERQQQVNSTLSPSLK
jgi:hypothetical protein